MTRLASGGFLATWLDASGTGGDSIGGGSRLRSMAAGGEKLGGEFLVNSIVAGLQVQPSATALASGGFVIAWSDTSGLGGDASGFGVKAQIFDAGGGRVGGEFLVNSTTNANQQQPTITGLAGGGFVTVWSDEFGDASQAGLRGQIYDAAGDRVGGEFLVNTTAQLDQRTAVTAASAGRRLHRNLVGFQRRRGRRKPSQHQGADLRCRWATRSAASCSINSQIAESQFAPTVGVLASGNIVIAWADRSGSTVLGSRSERFGDQGADPQSFRRKDRRRIPCQYHHGSRPGDSCDHRGGQRRIRGQLADRHRRQQFLPGWRHQGAGVRCPGAKVGTEFLVSNSPAGGQNDPQIAAIDSSGFVATWVNFRISADADINSRIFLPVTYGTESADTSPAQTASTSSRPGEATNCRRQRGTRSTAGGNDQIYGDVGDDTMDGGAGNDVSRWRLRR